MAEQYIIIPGTQQRVYEGSVVMLHRLPNLRWILHNGYYSYNGRKQKGWYFSSIPSDTTMPVFNEDLVAMTVIDGSAPVPPGPCPPGPFPPGPIPPGPGPVPPAPIPIPFTPRDKAQLDSAMITVDDIAERDKLSGSYLPDGKIVRVNDSDGKGTIEYYSWNSETSSWDEASLGYRYITREEFEQLTASNIVEVEWKDEEGALVLTQMDGDTRPVDLKGIAHNIVADDRPDEIILTFPVFGQEDIVINVPKGSKIISLRFEKEYEFPDGSVKPAIVVTVVENGEQREIPADASGMVNIYQGGETNTATVWVESVDGVITADVRIASIVNNRLKISVDGGLYVELTDIEDRLSELERRATITEGEVGELVVTTEDGIQRSDMKIGGSTLSETGSDKLLTTEEAVIRALSWRDV